MFFLYRFSIDFSIQKLSNLLSFGLAVIIMINMGHDHGLAVCGVCVREREREKGLAVRLLECVRIHPSVSGHVLICVLICVLTCVLV